MDRREALKTTARVLGGTIIGADLFLAGCKPSEKKHDTITDADVALLDDIGETILPETSSSPGAKAANIGAFMRTMVHDCYHADEQKAFMEGIQQLSKKDFQHLPAAEKQKLLIALDEEAKAYDKQSHPLPHYFTMMKQLTVLGYFTSEPGATKALRYLPIPGRYDACIPYNEGERAWAT
jgi:hypothetical protein